MTLPNNVPPNPVPPFHSTGPGSGTPINDLINRTQPNVSATLLTQQKASTNWGGVGSTLNAQQNAPVDPSRLPVVPVSHISSAPPNLLIGGSFDKATTFVAKGQWSWDGTVDHTGNGGGSAKVVANATLQAMNSTLIKVSPGDTFSITGWVQWSGVVNVNNSNAFQLGVQPVNNGTVAPVPTVLAAVANPATNGSWFQLTANYNVPSSGVTHIAVQIMVGPNITTGSVWWDDLSAIKTGILSGNLVTGPSGGTILQDQQNTWNNIVNQLTGQTGTGWGQSNAATALAQQAAATAAASASIAALQTKQTAADNSGFSVTVNFSGNANSSTLPAMFTQIPNGASSIGISNGAAVWQPVGTTTSAAAAMYNVQATATDYQLISAVFNTSPNGGFGGGANGPYNFLYGRANSASNPTAYVYAELQSGAVVLGCVNGGVNTVFGTQAFTFHAGAIYSLVCGISGSIATYEVLCNGAPVLSYVDVGNVAARGSGYRWAGWGMLGYYSGLFGWYLPANMLQWGVADNAPVPTIGSYLRVYRGGAASVALVAGANELPANFFDAIDRQTSDITWNAATSTATIGTTGTYVMVLRLLGAGTYNNVSWMGAVYRNGLVEEYGLQQTSGSTGGTVATMRDTFVFYAQAGDTIIPGYDLLAGTASLKGAGDSVSCYMTLAKVNPLP